jgi:hypothetical protein
MGITPGGPQGLMESDVGAIAGAICFDLNFYPILFRRASQHPDMVIFSSMYHGGMMQRVWAYFCRTHFVGSIAGEPNTILNPAGVELYTNTKFLPIVNGTINLDGSLFHLDLKILDGNKYEKAKKYYGPTLKVSDPGYLNVVYMSSESEEFTIEDVIERFKFERLDDYFDRSIKYNTEARGEVFL